MPPAGTNIKMVLNKLKFLSNKISMQIGQEYQENYLYRNTMRISPNLHDDIPYIIHISYKTTVLVTQESLQVPLSLNTSRWYSVPAMILETFADTSSDLDSLGLPWDSCTVHRAATWHMLRTNTVCCTVSPKRTRPKFRLDCSITTSGPWRREHHKSATPQHRTETNKLNVVMSLCCHVQGYFYQISKGGHLRFWTFSKTSFGPFLTDMLTFFQNLSFCGPFLCAMCLIGYSHYSGECASVRIDAHSEFAPFTLQPQCAAKRTQCPSEAQRSAAKRILEFASST